MYFLSFLSERVHTFPERCHIPGKARQENQLHRPHGRRRFCCSYHRRRSRPRGHVLVLRRSAPFQVWRWAARSGPPECRPAARFARTSPPWGWRCRHWENCHCDHLLVENPRRGSFVNACATSSDVTKSVGTTQGEHVPVDKRQSEYVTVSTQREHMTVKYATANTMEKKNVTVRRHKARATRDRRQRKADMWRMRGNQATVNTTQGRYVTDARNTRDSQHNGRKIRDRCEENTWQSTQRKANTRQYNLKEKCDSRHNARQVRDGTTWHKQPTVGRTKRQHVARTRHVHVELEELPHLGWRLALDHEFLHASPRDECVGAETRLVVKTIKQFRLKEMNGTMVLTVGSSTVWFANQDIPDYKTSRVRWKYHVMKREIKALEHLALMGNWALVFRRRSASTAECPTLRNLSFPGQRVGVKIKVVRRQSFKPVWGWTL